MKTRAPKVFTDPAIRALKAGAVAHDYRDKQTRGLIVRVLPSGLVQFCVRYRFRGTQRRALLGTYPGLTLAKARTRAERTRVEARDAHDPAQALRDARAPRIDTLAALSAEYLTKHARKQKRTADEDARVFDVYVLPKLGARSVNDITRKDVRQLVEAIADRGAPIMANRVLEILRKAFNWAIRDGDWEIEKGNPAAGIKKPGKEQARGRVLTDDEIRELWALLGRFPATPQKQAPGRKRATKDATGLSFCPISPALAAVQKIRLITAQRGGEVVRMRWADLDLPGGWWTIPPEHSKNGKAHRVPLSADAIAIITAQEPDEAKRVESVFVGRKGALLEDRVKKAGAALSRVLKFEFWSHDLRRTAATRMAAAGIPGAHISHVLNHTPAGPKSTHVYNRYAYDREKQIALDSWTRTLRGVLANAAPAARVFAMARGRR